MVTLRNPAGNADKQYGQRFENIEALMRGINRELAAHTERTEAELHWGHVGDLGHVQELLEQAYHFLRNEE